MTDQSSGTTTPKNGEEQTAEVEATVVVEDNIAHVIGLWVVTLAVALIFVFTLSPEPSQKAASHSKAKATQHRASQKHKAPPLNITQTEAPLPAGHPNIEGFQSDPAAPAMPTLPTGHPSLNAVPPDAHAQEAQAYAQAQEAQAYAQAQAQAHRAKIAQAPLLTSADTAKDADKYPQKTDDQEPHMMHWGYGRMGGPAQWGIMKKEYLTCGTGDQQSPINIIPENTIGSKVGDIVFNYQPSPLEVVNDGHTIQVNYAPGSNIQVGGKTFELLQFHFHSPSEHQINNEFFDMEVHLVHKSADGELAVIGVMQKKGLKNRAMEEIWNNFPRDVNAPATVLGSSINAADLIPADRNDFYHYMGSLTTPPCSEIVNWFVMEDFISVTEQQVTMLTNAVGKNNRPEQPLNRRHVLVNK